MTVEFTAHNIRLDDGTTTKPGDKVSMESYPWFVSARRILEAIFPNEKRHLRLADLGCLEGGYAVEFARMGFQVLGIEIRASNIMACEYVKSRVDLPNLTFAKDDAWNIAEHGPFDAVFCCGLLYHLDKPKAFLELLSKVTTRVVILQTHFSPRTVPAKLRLPLGLRKTLMKITKDPIWHYSISRVSENEGLLGRWVTEYADDKAMGERAAHKWSSWDNRRSFWIQREYLLQAIQEAGFDLVMEQFDCLRPSIAQSMLRGFYRDHSRGTFIGVKTQRV